MLTAGVAWVVYDSLTVPSGHLTEMPQDKKLTDIEVLRLCFLRGTGKLFRCIPKEIRRSKTGIHIVIKRGIDDSIQNRSGEKSKLS